MEYFEFLLGWFLGIASLVIAEVIGYLFTKKNMKAEHEHSEKMFRIQLYQEDKKKALIELDELLKKKYNTFRDFQASVESYLDGSSGMFVPENLKEDLRQEIRSVNDFMAEKIEQIYGPEPELDDYDDWAEDISPEEELDQGTETRLRGLRTNMREKIRKYVSEE